LIEGFGWQHIASGTEFNWVKMIHRSSDWAHHTLTW
jgi:hypothetical protein